MTIEADMNPEDLILKVVTVVVPEGTERILGEVAWNKLYCSKKMSKSRCAKT
ncbi:hypothetical protein FQR65_LT10608 [Abscondita terminalis]|nr:hypothetical protein FQR65_LT10608 [Abscondita terminalis]